MKDEQEQTTPADALLERKWVTVDEAFVLCQEAGLDRTKKTIRSWCRHEHLESQKQTTPTGERWMVEASSLQVKIRNELEFQNQSEPVRTSVNPSEQVRTEDTPVRTRTHQYERMRTGTDESEPMQETGEDKKRIEALEAQVRSLDIDKAVRDKHIDFLTKQNEEGQRQLLSQSRYIGHLETTVFGLGGTPDPTFLQPPVPVSVNPAEPVKDGMQSHPNQTPLDIHT